MIPHLFRTPGTLNNTIFCIAAHNSNDKPDHFTDLVKHEALTFDPYLHILEIINEEGLTAFNLLNIPHRRRIIRQFPCRKVVKVVTAQV